MTLTTLVTGASISKREVAIAGALEADKTTALILEGIPDGRSPLDAMAGSSASSYQLRIFRIAPGCLCCTGNLTMRVTLNRLLRQPPQRLFISLASAEHLDRLHAFLHEPPYCEFLKLTKDLQA